MKKGNINPEVIDGSLRIYTDGSAVAKNEKPGGWGVYVTDGNGYSAGFKGRAIGTTVSVMEMYAMRVAIDFSVNHWDKHQKQIMIYSDSEMVVKSINLGWLQGWHREKYLNRKNSELWKEIYSSLQKVKLNKVNLKIYHIRGHQNALSHPHVFGNHVADKLADYKS